MGRKDANRSSVQRYRERMKRAGMRLVQLWVPDTRAEGFEEECRRQSRAAAKHRRLERETLEWIERVSDLDGWTA